MTATITKLRINGSRERLTKLTMKNAEHAHALCEELFSIALTPEIEADALTAMARLSRIVILAMEAPKE